MRSRVSDRLLLIVAPAAVQSEYVLSEWQHALLFSKPVIPLLQEGEYSLIPEELQGYHCPDFRLTRPFEDAFQELLRILQEPLPPLGRFLTPVPSLPPHF